MLPPPEKLLNIKVGEMAVSDQPVAISTLLGSCLAVCLYSPEGLGGGINHFASPDRGEESTHKLVRDVTNLTKQPPVQLRAKLVGGANAIGKDTIGQSNIEKARDILKQYGIIVAGEDVGGQVGRRVIFYPQTGRLRVSKMEAIGAVEQTPAPAVPQPEPPAVATPVKKRILVVDDSKTICDLLTTILNKDPELEVVGTAPNPLVAEKMIADLKPDVLTLDIHMPEMDGVTFLKQLMQTHPMPVVMITSVSKEEGPEVLTALELGAVDYLQKPVLSELAQKGPIIRKTVRVAADVKVHKNNSHGAKPHSRVGALDYKDSYICIGASTGGTRALTEFFSELPEQIPPTLVVQHIPPVFSKAFANRLDELMPFEVLEASDGDEIIPNRVLVAPGGKQMAIEKRGQKLVAKIFDGEPVNGHKPSVDVLFESAAKNLGGKAVGIIMTGMGNDGAAGLLTMRQNGARTFAQDEASCVVFGMPKEAIKLGAAEQVVSLDDMALALQKILKNKNGVA